MEGHRDSSLLQSQHPIHSQIQKGFLVKFRMTCSGAVWWGFPTEVIWSKSSKNKFNRPKGDEKSDPGEGNSVHKMWTLKGPGTGSAWKSSGGLECYVGNWTFGCAAIVAPRPV